MVRKGYIQQQIEGLTLLLTRLPGIRTQGEVEGVLAEIRNGAKSLTGMDLDHLLSVPEPMFLSLFQSGFQKSDRIDAGKAAIVGTLLLEEAEECKRQSVDTKRNPLRLERAHRLLGVALAQEPLLRTPEMLTRLLILKRQLPPPTTNS